MNRHESDHPGSVNTPVISLRTFGGLLDSLVGRDLGRRAIRVAFEAARARSTPCSVARSVAFPRYRLWTTGTIYWEVWPSVAHARRADIDAHSILVCP